MKYTNYNYIEIKTGFKEKSSTMKKYEQESQNVFNVWLWFHKVRSDLKLL